MARGIQAGKQVLTSTRTAAPARVVDRGPTADAVPCAEVEACIARVDAQDQVEEPVDYTPPPAPVVKSKPDLRLPVYSAARPKLTRTNAWRVGRPDLAPANSAADTPHRLSPGGRKQAKFV